MAIKLHRCSATWVKVSGHPCWRVQKALDDAGVEYEVVQEGSAFKRVSREQTIGRTGQKRFPWIEFEDGSVYREESKKMAETIKAGRLDEKKTGAAASLDSPAAGL